MSIYDLAIREFEKLYDSRMAVSENVTTKVGAITKTAWQAVDGFQDIPCRISQKRTAQATDSLASEVVTITVLYCNPLLKIKPGSRITITDVHGGIHHYKHSSNPFSSYKTHQEIVIVKELKA